MKLLLDTHIWIWSLSEPERLTRSVTRQIEREANQLWLSPISVWETLLLVEKGRVKVRGRPGHVVTEMLKAGPFREAPITHVVATRSREVVVPHDDPADRFLAATAAVYGLTLVTADERLWDAQDYSVLPNR